MECINCGLLGHSFRDCKAPVMSYGIVAFRFQNGIPNYLLIQRRDSLAYVEFLRGKYNMNDSNYIQVLVDAMTIDERKRLMTKSFETLWVELWNSQNTRQYRNEFETAQKQFNTLKTIGNSYGKLLPFFLENSKTEWKTPEWGFPKGRRNSQESIKSCAIREFTEETGVSRYNISVLQTEPYVEQYKGTNGIDYKQTYFLALFTSDTKVSFDSTNRVLTREVGDLAWLSYENALEKIRPTNYVKREILQKIHMDVVDKFSNLINELNGN